jgi:small subunit ribosomal protein S10
MATKEPKTKKSATKEEGTVMLRIRVRAYENKVLDTSVKQIIDTALRHDAKVQGPIPLPTEIKKYTVIVLHLSIKTLVNSLRFELTSV